LEVITVVWLYLYLQLLYLLKVVVVFHACEFCNGCRYSFTKALCIAFVMTFFSPFDVPVFWPILLCYWFVLFVLTMRRQVAHMIKYKYIPFNLGKQVGLILRFSFHSLFVQLLVLYLYPFFLKYNNLFF